MKKIMASLLLVTSLSAVAESASVQLNVELQGLMTQSYRGSVGKIQTYVGEKTLLKPASLDMELIITQNGQSATNKNRVTEGLDAQASEAQCDFSVLNDSEVLVACDDADNSIVPYTLVDNSIVIAGDDVKNILLKKTLDEATAQLVGQFENMQKQQKLTISSVPMIDTGDMVCSFANDTKGVALNCETDVNIKLSLSLAVEEK